ncbi:endonuclease/exonuclease/phosphatase family protein [Streptacidiphilus monticola]
MVTSATAVATWNVLHRVHAENWSSHVLDRWPDEAERIAAVSAWVARTSEAVIALQEVSGDQLASLRQALPVSRTVHSFRYPRVPKPRRVPTRLSCRDEHLVLVLDGPPGRWWQRRPSRPTRARGCSRCGPGPAPRRHPRQHRSPASGSTGPSGRGGGRGRARPGRPARRLQRGPRHGRHGTRPRFHDRPLPPDAAPTRPRDVGAEKSAWIDHVVTHGADADEAAVEDVHGLSDHNPVRARVAPARQ